MGQTVSSFPSTLVKSKPRPFVAWHAGFGMNGGNSRTINDNYGALAAIRNTSEPKEREEREDRSVGQREPSSEFLHFIAA